MNSFLSPFPFNIKLILVCFVLIKSVLPDSLNRDEYDYKRVLKCLNDKRRCIIVSNQSPDSILIYDLSITNQPIWQFYHQKNFRAVSEAKIAYKDYIIFTCSSGVFGLIDLRTKTLLDYHNFNGNLHSVDLAPDGTYIVVSSTENKIIVVPAYKSCAEREINHLTYEFPYGHAVVWDYQRSKVWIGGNRTISTFKYNFNSKNPKLKFFESFYVDSDQVHDMAPIPNTDFMWVSTWKFIYGFNVKTGNIMRFSEKDDIKSMSTINFKKDLKTVLNLVEHSADQDNIQNVYQQRGINSWKNKKFRNLFRMLGDLDNSTKFREKTSKNNRDCDFLALVKSIKSQTIYIRPDDPETWWTENVRLFDTEETILHVPGGSIYKARWLIYNEFSYDLFYPKILE